LHFSSREKVTPEARETRKEGAERRKGGGGGR